MKEGNDKYCLFALDVETTSIWHNTLRDKTGKTVAYESVPRLLALFKEKNIQTTFFITGYFARLFPDCVKSISDHGHEVGSHSLYHDIASGHDVTDLETQISHLQESKKILQEITGKEVISFRAPALRVNRHTPVALSKTGFKIDSSIASQRFDMFLSFGGLKKLNWLLAPRQPYRTDTNSLFKRGTGSIIEIPLTAFFLPYLGTTMRIFPNVTALQRRLVHFESSLSAKPIVFDFHPNEIVDESDEPQKTTRRSQNYIGYLLKDLIRTRLKLRNLGDDALKLYQKELDFFLDKGYQFISIEQYCKIKKLL